MSSKNVNDVRSIYHQLAFKHNFSTFKLETMIQRIASSYIAKEQIDEDEIYEMEMDFASSQSLSDEFYEDQFDESDSAPMSLISSSNIKEEEFEFNLDNI